MGKEERHEFFSIVLLGVGTLFLMAGYDTQSFVVESVMHSVSAREPGKIDPHAGYYGQAGLYAAYAVAALITPWMAFRLGSRMAMLFGSFLFTLYMCSFFYLNAYFYYSTQLFMGVGFALYYSGQGLYMAEHSTRETLSRNSALVTMIGNAGMFLGGVLLYPITLYTSSHSAPQPVFNVSEESSSKPYKHFSETDIYMLFGMFAAFTVMANVFFGLLPKKQYDSIAQNEKVDEPTMKTQIILIGGAMKETKIMLLTFFFILYGFVVSFMLSALPTTFSFTKSLSGYNYLHAIYSACLGIGNIIMGLTYNFYFSKRFANFGLSQMMGVQIVVSFAAYAIILMVTPNMASIHPTSDDTLLLPPSGFWCPIMGLLLGMCDGCLGPLRVIACTMVSPKKKLQTYSVAKLYQSLASCIAFFASPYLSMQQWILLLSITQIIAGVTFFVVARSIGKHSVAPAEKVIDEDKKDIVFQMSKLENTLQ